MLGVFRVWIPIGHARREYSCIPALPYLPALAAQIVPFTEVPALCEAQLRGADVEHWEALLTYLEVAGTKHPNPLPNDVDPGVFAVDNTHREAERKRGLTEQRFAPDVSEAASAGEKRREGSLGKARSVPTLGLIRTATDGGWC